MSAQEHKSPQRRDGEPDGGDDAPEVPTAPTAQVKDEETDSMLDEIDSVLESNAEEFVRGFVQKGGQ
ncbi:ubiquitin-like protein Pup [Demetria terragena]|uniref:ubiquitin-like protein Pup n=1 Tax=Demetria terragena TaxID=63959 RepID=UPI00036C2EBA|nr:ubiquitin-like protein Pup [Demetria terragena]